MAPFIFLSLCDSPFLFNITYLNCIYNGAILTIIYGALNLFQYNTPRIPCALGKRALKIVRMRFFIKFSRFLHTILNGALYFLSLCVSPFQFKITYLNCIYNGSILAIINGVLNLFLFYSFRITCALSLESIRLSASLLLASD